MATDIYKDCFSLWTPCVKPFSQHGAISPPANWKHLHNQCLSKFLNWSTRATRATYWVKPQTRLFFSRKKSWFYKVLIHSRRTEDRFGHHITLHNFTPLWACAYHIMMSSTVEILNGCGHFYQAISSTFPTILINFEVKGINLQESTTKQFT